jgi:hypothetical protein
MSARDLAKLLEGRWSAGWLLVWRKITRNTDERTFIPCVLPRVAVANSAITGFPGRGPAACLLANMSAFVFDYSVRQKLGGTNMLRFITEQLPVLPPEVYATDALVLDTPVTDWVESRVLELVFTSSDMKAFALEHGYEGPPFRWDPERRVLIRAELDGVFFHLYGLDVEDVDYVMETFPVVKRRDEEKYGHYRTKALILDAYRRIADASVTGVPYETILDPPPADPRVAHEARSSALVRE